MLTKFFASKIVVLTSEDAKEWHTKKVVAIPNSTPFVTENHSDYTSRNVISVGRLTYFKGFDLLIKAWTEVVKSHKDVILNIFGDGPDKTSLNKLIEEYGLQNHVIIHAPTRNIQAELLKSSIYILPSRYEPFGIVLLEAMECGLPIVAFDSIGPKSILKNDEDSILVKNGDIQQLSQSIIELLDNENLRTQMGTMSKENSQRYHIDMVIKDWEMLFS